MLAEEVRSLPPDARRVLEAAAVAGEPFEPDVAAEIGELSDGEVIDALDELLARDLVRTTDVPRHFRFRHPLVRRAVYAHAGGGWRLAAHGRAAAALARAARRPAAQAHHVEHSARRGDESAIALLRRAAAASAPRAPATAARWLQAAVRLVPEADAPGTPARRAALRRSPTRSGRPGGSRRAGPRCCRRSRSSPDDVRLVTECAAVEHWLGLHDEARARLDSALHELGAERSAGAVALRIERAIEALHELDFAAARRLAGDAHAIAGELDDAGALARAGAVLTLTDAAAGEIAAARERVGDAAAWIDGLGDGALAHDLAALWYLGWAEMYLERFDAGLAHLRRGIDISRATGRGDLIVPMLLGQARGLFSTGARRRRSTRPTRRSRSRAGRATRSTSSGRSGSAAGSRSSPATTRRRRRWRRRPRSSPAS